MDKANKDRAVSAASSDLDKGQTTAPTDGTTRVGSGGTGGGGGGGQTPKPPNDDKPKGRKE